MIHMTLAIKNGDSQKLDLPVKVEDVLTRPMPYYLAYGKATVEFATPDTELNEALNDLMAETVEGGVQELSLLAYLLGRMDDQRLELLRNNLPDEPCGIAELTRRASYFCDRYLDHNGKPETNVVPLEEYHDQYDHASLEERLRREFRRKLESQRMTGGQLFEKIMERAKENGDLARFDPINEYVLPETYEESRLCSYEFDMLPALGFGCEGIYIDCYLKGSFDESNRASLHIGTIKTLSTDLDACKIMGELCGTLLHHESKFVNENLYLFDSMESIERMLTKSLTVEQTQLETQTMTSQQM